MRSLRPPRPVLLFCPALVLGMPSVMAFPALLPGLRAEWGLSAAQAGWITGIFYAGYVLAVPVLSSLTDRIPAPRVFAAGLVACALAAAGFSTADGFGSAMLWRIMNGIGFAGVYIPGLKALSDRVEGPRQSRWVGFYTGSFSIGGAVSVLIAGRVGGQAGWELAYLACAAITLLPLPLVLLRAGPEPARSTPAAAAGPTWSFGRTALALLDPRPVLRQRAALGYTLGYAAHTWELFGYRGWIIAFLTWAYLAQSSPADGLPTPTDLGTLLLMLGLPASLLGNELCMRGGRRRWLCRLQVASVVVAGALAAAVGSAAPLAVVLALATLYAIAVMTDSAGFTAGVVAVALPGARGATLAVQSAVGFSIAIVAPLVVGLVLDAVVSVADERAAWVAAVLTMGIGVALGPLALLRLVPPDAPAPDPRSRDAAR